MSLVRARRGCRMRMKETKNNGCSCSLEVGSFLMERLGNISPPGSDWQGGEGGGGRVPDLVIRGTEQTPEDDNQRQGAPLRSIQGNYCDNPSQLRLVIVQTPQTLWLLHLHLRLHTRINTSQPPNLFKIFHILKRYFLFVSPRHLQARLECVHGPPSDVDKLV